MCVYILRIWYDVYVIVYELIYALNQVWMLKMFMIIHSA
jgi:hypothetical protein